MTAPPHGGDGLVDVPPLMVVVSALPLVAVALASRAMGLGLESQIGVSTLRTFVQLAVLGYILKPIFQEGEAHWVVVLAYLLVMVILAANESSSRSQYTFSGVRVYMFFAILFNVGLISMFAFGVVIRPENPLDPQYVIPICGMLFGNIINGVSLSLNALCTSLVEQRSEVELLLSFGASKYEASARLIRAAVRTGTMPTLNSMAVIGLISIPGMMTGQVLGGSAPDVAARYQMLIMYLIATCSFGTILCVLVVVMRVGFNGEHQLQPENFVKVQKTKQKGFFRRLASGVRHLFSRVCCFVCHYWCAARDGYRSLSGSDSGSQPLASPEDLAAFGRPNSVKVHLVTKPHHDEHNYLRMINLVRTVPAATGSKQQRVLFDRLSVNLGKGETAMVTGPSGCGKSQFLRLVAGLVPCNGGEILLNDKPRSSFASMCHWRQKVRYVTQYKVETPGTPREFCKTIAQLRVNRSTVESPNAREMVDAASRLLSQWGMSRGSLDKEWKELSGGEAQRVILALAMASNPKVLLLDESTSALDRATKLSVEQSIEQYSRDHAIAVLWITHDDEQINRLEKQPIEQTRTTS